MTLIVEGPNGAGKTELAKNLSKLFNIEYRKENKPDRPGFQYYLEKARYLHDVVLDRFHLGERVYPQIKQDGRVPLERWQQHEIERAMMSSNAILVACDASQYFLESVHDTRGEDFIKKSDIPEEVNLFKTAYEDTILPRIWSPVSESISAAERLGAVAAMIAKISNRVSLTQHMGTLYHGAGNIGFFGNPIMLIGERYADGTFVDDSVDHRALCGDKNGSAFLHRALDKLPSELSRLIYITNLWKHRDHSQNLADLEEEIRLLHPQCIIALGSNVTEALKGTSIDFSSVDHPQYRARFEYDRVDEYATDILRAMV